MADYGGIKPIILDDATKQKHEKFMADAFVVLSKAAKERAPTFGSVKLLRDGFKRGDCNLIHSPRARGIMQDMIALEGTILAGYIRMLNKLIVSFDQCGREQRPGVEYLDYVQEAAWGIYDAQYTFTGAEQFSTYSYWCARNRLVSFVRSEERASGISQAVKRLRLKVRHLMATYFLSFEDAVGRIQAEDDSITAEIIEKVYDALYKMSGNIDSYVPQTASEKSSEDVEDMRKAIEEADLTPLERALLKAQVAGDRRFRTELLERAEEVAARMLKDHLILTRGRRSFCDTVQQLQLDRDVTFPQRVVKRALNGVGPMLDDPLAQEIVTAETYKPISKQRISQYYVRACGKVKEVYARGKAEEAKEAA